MPCSSSALVRAKTLRTSSSTISTVAPSSCRLAGLTTWPSSSGRAVISGRSSSGRSSGAGRGCGAGGSCGSDGTGDRVGASASGM